MQDIFTPIQREDARVSRRKFMAIAAAGSAATLPAVALAEASGKTSRLPQHSSPDPVLIAVNRFTQALATFNALDLDDFEDESVAVEATYGPPLTVLEKWQLPATTRAGAAAALKLADIEEQNFQGSPVTRNMIRAALGWLEGGAS